MLITLNDEKQSVLKENFSANMNILNCDLNIIGYVNY